MAMFVFFYFTMVYTTFLLILSNVLEREDRDFQRKDLINSIFWPIYIPVLVFRKLTSSR